MVGERDIIVIIIGDSIIYFRVIGRVIGLYLYSL